MSNPNRGVVTLSLTVCLTFLMPTVSFAQEDDGDLYGLIQGAISAIGKKTTISVDHETEICKRGEGPIQCVAGVEQCYWNFIPPNRIIEATNFGPPAPTDLCGGSGLYYSSPTLFDLEHSEDANDRAFGQQVRESFPPGKENYQVAIACFTLTASFGLPLNPNPTSPNIVITTHCRK